MQIASFILYTICGKSQGAFHGRETEKRMLGSVFRQISTINLYIMDMQDSACVDDGEGGGNRRFWKDGAGKRNGAAPQNEREFLTL